MHLISFGKATGNPKRAAEPELLGSNLQQQFLVRKNTEHLFSSEKITPVAFFIHTWQHNLPAMFNVTKMLTAHGGNIGSMLKTSWEGPGETLHKLCKHFMGYSAGTFLEHL